MTQESAVEILHEIAREVDGTIDDCYSGRGMYGATCYGIIAVDALEVINLASEQGIKGAKMANLGRNTLGRNIIIYWPKIEGRAA